MSSRSLLCLTLLLLCICSLHARPRLGCRCITPFARRMPLSSIKKIEVFPVSGSCPRIQIRITRKNGRVVCADPNWKWVQELIREIQQAQLSVNQM